METLQCKHTDNTQLTIFVEDWAEYDGRFTLWEDSYSEIGYFAVCFYPSDIRNTSEEKKIIHLSNTDYELHGQVMFIDAEYGWVIDCGLRFFTLKSLDSHFKVGDFVTCTASLGFEPLMDIYDLYDNRGYPDIIYHWEITKRFQKLYGLKQVDSKVYEVTDECYKTIELHSRKDYEWQEHDSKYSSVYEICIQPESNQPIPWDLDDEGDADYEFYEKDEKLKIALDPDISEQSIKDLLDDTSKIVISCLAENPSLPEAIQLELAEKKDEPYIRWALARNPKLPASLVKKFSQSDDPKLKACLSTNPSLSPDSEK